jgi:phage terminase small subunit
MEALKYALTYRQRRFCEEYVIDFNGRASVVRAGYSSKWPDRQAYELLMNPGVVRYIEHLSQSAAAKMMSVDPDYVIKSVTEIVSKETARDGDKLRGLELLARILGMLVEKKEVTGKDGGPIAIEETQKEAREFTEMLKRIRKTKIEKEIELI